MIEKLLERLNNLHKMDEPLIERISKVTQIVTYPKKSYLLSEGQVYDKAWMVVKGLAWADYINGGRDITSRFMDEVFIITS